MVIMKALFCSSVTLNLQHVYTVVVEEVGSYIRRNTAAIFAESAACLP